MSDFMELASCPGCGSPMAVEFEGDCVWLSCDGCEREYGHGAKRAEARTLCVYWNLIHGEHNAGI